MSAELNTGKIASNTLLLYLRMFVTLVIALISSRVVLNKLGVDDYGIYNIVGSVVVLFSFISTPLSSSLQRFLNVEMGRGDMERVKTVFNSSFISFVIIIFIVALLTETIGLWVFYNKIQIPPERFEIAREVFHISLITFCFSILKSPFEAVLLAYERMDAYAYFSIFDALVKLGFVFFLSKTAVDALLFYAIGLCGISLLNVLLYFIYCIANFSIVRFTPGMIRKDVIYEVLSFSGWSTLGSFVYTGLTSGINFIINFFFGVKVNAAVGIKNQVVSAVYGFVSNFQVAFKPQLFQLYGAGELTDFYKLTFFASKLSSFLYFCLIFPLLPVLPIVLQLWLGHVPEYTVDFIWLGLCFNIIPACDGPLWMAVYATGNIKRYQIIMNSIELTSIPIIILLCRWGLPPQSVFVTRIIIESVVFVVRLFYMKRYLSFPLLSYLRNVFIPINSVIIPLLISALILTRCSLGIMNSVFIILFQLSLVLLLSLFLGLSKVERHRVSDMIKQKLSSR